MTHKLWQTGSMSGLQPAVEDYTVGDDYLLDQELLGYDIQASKAHAGMLQSIGVLTADECSALHEALDDLYKRWCKGDFTVQKDQEDGHTAIETYLVDKLGATGKKIHTTRSRNDQALVMMRLYLKDKLYQASLLAAELGDVLDESAKRHKDIQMPGYTHMQKAMPTTVSAWLGSYADGFGDTASLAHATLGIIDQNPLGSAAGFDISLPVDKSHTTKSLGFGVTQDNPMYCGLSRGLFELMCVQALSPIMVLAGKFAHDMMLFTTQEFNLFSLPGSFTTGSSIMPHKQNYDVFEIMRGRAATFGALVQQLQTVAGGAGSGYHRDLQLTKGVTMEAFKTAISTLEVLKLIVPALKPHKNKLEESITKEMQSVAEINKLVNNGVPFRDAYAVVKESLSKAKKERQLSVM